MPAVKPNGWYYIMMITIWKRLGLCLLRLTQFVLALYCILCVVAVLGVKFVVTRVPGSGAADEASGAKLSAPDGRKLRNHVQFLEKELRHYGKTATAYNYIKAEFETIKQKFSTLANGQQIRIREIPVEGPDVILKSDPPCDHHPVIPLSWFEGHRNTDEKRHELKNIELEITASRDSKHKDEVILIGAHYDSDLFESHHCNKQSVGTPGADDNATGVAALIELANHFVELAKNHEFPRTVRFVAFANEEEPFFQTQWMGSFQYAQQQLSCNCIKAMISLETMGYYSDGWFSQRILPKDFYMDSLFDWVLYLFNGFQHRGNFITFIGNEASLPLVTAVANSFKKSVAFSFEGIVAPSYLPGTDFSDHWSFWQFGVPAIMVTDTAPNRNKCYHMACDRSDRLDFERFGQVVLGLRSAIRDLVERWPGGPRKT